MRFPATSSPSRFSPKASGSLRGDFKHDLLAQRRLGDVPAARSLQQAARFAHTPKAALLAQFHEKFTYMPNS